MNQDSNNKINIEFFSSEGLTTNKSRLSRSFFYGKTKGVKVEVEYDLISIIKNAFSGDLYNLLIFIVLISFILGLLITPIAFLILGIYLNNNVMAIVSGIFFIMSVYVIFLNFYKSYKNQ